MYEILSIFKSLCTQIHFRLSKYVYKYLDGQWICFTGLDNPLARRFYFTITNDPRNLNVDEIAPKCQVKQDDYDEVCNGFDTPSTCYMKRWIGQFEIFVSISYIQYLNTFFFELKVCGYLAFEDYYLDKRFFFPNSMEKKVSFLSYYSISFQKNNVLSK